MHIGSTATQLAGEDHLGAHLSPSSSQLGQLAKAIQAELPLLISPAVTQSIPLPAIEDATSIHALATSDLAKLAQIIQPAPQPERVQQLAKLVEETVKAVADGRVEWAVGRVVEAATLHPLQAEEFRSMPELAPIQGNIEHLMGRLTTVAKIDAESKISQAEQVMEDNGWAKLPHWDTKPETLLQIAHRLYEAGGYSNFVRSAELADATMQSAFWGASLDQQMVPLVTEPAKLEEDESVTGKPRDTAEAAVALLQYSWYNLRAKVPPRIDALWQRAPLLVLLFGWLMAGVIGGVLSLVVRKIWPDGWAASLTDLGFQTWGLGFLALVGFGFWARIRKQRF